MPKHEGPDSFLDMVHVALKLRADILAHHMYKGSLRHRKRDDIMCTTKCVYILASNVWRAEPIKR